MNPKSIMGLFRTRNIMGVVLVAGICAGIYLADFLKGFGLGGSGTGLGTGPTKQDTKTRSTSEVPGKDMDDSSSKPDEIVGDLSEFSSVVKVVIDKWSYFLRTADGEKEVKLQKIVELAKAAKGDDDGIRVRIYRKMTARPQAELDLENALTAAGIQEKQRVFMPNPVQ